MSETKEKKVLLEIGNVRIKEYDTLNVQVERYEVVFNPKENQTINKWQFKGYSKGILSALLFIQRNELLIDKNDKNTVKDLESYLKQVDDSNNKLLAAVKGN